MSSFPENRMRRMRATPALRRIVQETRLSVSDLIYPVFVTQESNGPHEIEPMPGIYQHSLDSLQSEVATVAEMGIPAVLVFGIPSHKDEIGSEGYAPNGIIQEAIRVIKQTQPELAVIGDVCMCEYTSHGHCGILLEDGTVDNDRTLDLLAETAVSQAEAGVDIVAPSAMMDGQVVAIRDALDDHDHENVPIMAYSAKYASSFYGPFRTAGRVSAPDGRPQGIPDGFRERERGDARDRGGHLRRRGRCDGEARAGLPGRHREGKAAFRHAPRRLQRQWGILHGEGGSGKRLDRRAVDCHGDTDGHQEGGSGHDNQLPRQGWLRSGWLRWASPPGGFQL